jgi:hypothetical protein
MITKNHPTPLTPQQREELATKLGKFILDNVPYSGNFHFPTLPPAPTGGTFELPPSPPAPPPPTHGSMPDGLKIPPRYQTENVVDMDGLYPGLSAAVPLKPQYFASNGQMMDWDVDGKMLYWEMGDAYHQITKAIRVWYTYTVPAYEGPGPDGAHVSLPERTFGTWLVLGYVGDGH